MDFQCGVCQRTPSGLGWSQPPSIHNALYGNPRRTATQDHRQRHRRRFCSMLCQGLYHDVYQTGITMNQHEIETQARQQALQSLADYVVAIGMEKPLADYSHSEISGLIESVLIGYQNELQNIYKNEIPF